MSAEERTSLRWLRLRLLEGAGLEDWLEGLLLRAEALLLLSALESEKEVGIDDVAARPARASDSRLTEHRPPSPTGTWKKGNQEVMGQEEEDVRADDRTSLRWLRLLTQAQTHARAQKEELHSLQFPCRESDGSISIYPISKTPRRNFQRPICVCPQRL